MKTLLLGLAALGFAALSQTASADLVCQGYGSDGVVLDFKLTAQLMPTRNSQVAIGKTTLQIGQKKSDYVLTYVFGNAQTRCAAGPTISTDDHEIQLNVFAFNSCDPSSQVPGLEGDFKGTLTVADVAGSTTEYFVGCRNAGE